MQGRAQHACLRSRRCRCMKSRRAAMRSCWLAQKLPAALCSSCTRARPQITVHAKPLILLTPLQISMLDWCRFPLALSRGHGSCREVLARIVLETS